MKDINKRKVIIIVSVVVPVLLLIIGSLFLSATVKMPFEIDLENYNLPKSITKQECGIQCGGVSINLGDVIDITPYTIENETVINNSRVLQLLSPSKKYELVVAGYQGYYNVVEIRTTIPDVYYTAGFKVADTKSKVKSFMKLPNKSKVKYSVNENTFLYLYFYKDLLCVIDVKLV